MSLRAWAEIASDPALLFYARQDPRPFVTGVKYPYLLEIGTVRRALNGENANVTLTLDNSRGQLTALLALPPLRARAAVYLDENGVQATVLAGLIMAVRMGGTVELSVEA